MCKVGDIIVVKEYISEDGKVMKQHSFVVVDDNPDSIKGLNYSFVSNVMSSFKSEEHKIKKLRFEENIGITSDDIDSSTGNFNSKDGYIKADQLYYFDKEKIDYYVLASVKDDLLDELIKIIIKLEVENKLKKNIKNIEEQTEAITNN